MFKNGSMSYGYQWKVDTHGSADARQWTLVGAQTGTLDAQSYSFTSPAQSVTDSRAGTLAALGNSIFGFFKGGSFGGHVAANVTVALGPRLRDAINSYMQHSFGDYSKQVNQDTKKLQDSNAQLQKDLTKGQGSQNQQDIKNLGNQIGTESGQLQKDISQYQKSTAQGVYDILNKYGQQPQKKSQQAPAPGLPPAKQNDPASGTRPPFKPPAGQSTTGAPPNPGGTSNPSGSGPQGGSSSRPGGGAQSGGTSIQRGPVQGLPGTQSGPAATPPSQPPASGAGANPDVNPDGTLNTPPLDRTEPDGTPFQSVPAQPATPGQDPTKPPVIVPPAMVDNGAGSQVAGQTADGTPVTTASDSAPAQAAPPPAAPVEAPPPAPLRRQRRPPPRRQRRLWSTPRRSTSRLPPSPRSARRP